MTDFISYIYNFVSDIINSLMSLNGNSALLSKNIFFDNSLIGLNLTWSDLFYTMLPLILIGLFIVLFVKFVWKLIGLVRF